MPAHTKKEKKRGVVKKKRKTRTLQQQRIKTNLNFFTETHR